MFANFVTFNTADVTAVSFGHNGLRIRNRFNQVVEDKRFEGVFLCRKVC